MAMRKTGGKRMSADKSVKIRKFTRPQILFHWLYGGAWIVLVLTGAIFLWRPDPHATAGGLGPLLQGSVGQWARLIHRVAAMVLMAAPFIWLAGDRQSLFADLKELLAWTRDDLKYLALAPLHYTFGKPALPPQGKYNGGHKANFWVVLLTFIGFVVSGLWMWFGREGIQVTKEAFRLMLLIHNLCFWAGLLMGILHMYLTLIHPFTRQALESMVSGYVNLGYARAEHRVWVEKQLQNGEADLVEEPQVS